MTARFIRIRELASDKGKQGRLPVSSPTIWRWVREGKFPVPRVLGDNITAWPIDEIEAWEQTRKAAA